LELFWLFQPGISLSVSSILFIDNFVSISKLLKFICLHGALFFSLVLSVEPVIGAIAAGNAVVLKPSEIAPAASSLLAKLFSEYLDNTTIRVIEGGVPETTALLDQKWDKIFFTGLSSLLFFQESLKC